MLEKSSIQNLDNSDYRLKIFEEYKTLEKVNWKRVGYQYEEPEAFKEFNNLEIKNENQDGVVIKNISESLEELEKLKNENDYGLGDFFKKQNFAFYNEGKYLKIGERKKIDKPIYLNYHTNKENNFLVDYNVIEVEDFAKVTVIINYDSLDETPVYHNGIIKVVTGRNSEVKIIKIQTLNTKSSNFESSKIETMGQGKTEYYSVELGGKINAISHKSYLEEDSSEVYVWPAYLADEDRKLDLEYSVVFRGNLYFKQGSSKSEGREGEFAILLNDEIKADSIPTLFCSEDDVIGEHAASVGKVDEAKLFYLMSRGLSESRAKKLIVESSFRPIMDNIDDEKLRDKLFDELERRI